MTSIDYPLPLFTVALASIPMNSVPLPVQAAGVGLLVSVRSLDELRAVAKLGIDVLDFKEPRRGPLAAASPELWRLAGVESRQGCPLSAALGEWDTAVELAGLVPQQFAYAKAGPAGVRSVARLTTSWTRIRSLLAAGIELVAVAYADHQRAHCPEPEAIFQAAADAGIQTWLLDTFEKADRRDSITLLGARRLAEIDRMAKRSASHWVLAGSINRPAATELLSQGVRPALLGVRGDVCDRSRGGQIIPARITGWLELLRSFAHQVNHGDDRQRAEAEA